MKTIHLNHILYFLMLCVATCIAPSAQGSQLLTVNATDSIYQVFGHSGSALNDATNAQWVAFAAGSNNFFNISATGNISNCCTLRGPDGLMTSTSTTTGVNGLSNASGNSALPLLGVFLNETDPVGSTPPPALAYDALNPTSLAPVLGQIFYIGDGQAGFNNSTGLFLTFAAPATATRLYLGIADGFGGPPTKYGDNSGTFSVQITTVPLPKSYTMMMAGLGLITFIARRRKLGP